MKTSKVGDLGWIKYIGSFKDLKYMTEGQSWFDLGTIPYRRSIPIYVWLGYVDDKIRLCGSNRMEWFLDFSSDSFFSSI